MQSLAEGDSATPSPQTAPLVRVAAVVYALLVIYGSLAPWQDWRAIGVSPFAFLLAPVPRHLTSFDLALNVVAYLPLGILAGLALYPRRRGAALIVVAASAGIALSFLLEALQTYLPARIASNVDLALNAAGALLGATIAAALAPALARDRLHLLRVAWFGSAPGLALVIAIAWPLTQVHPAASLFAAGTLDRPLIAWLLSLADLRLPRFDAAEFVAAEVLISTAAMLSAGLTLLAALRPTAPRVSLVAALLLISLLVKTAVYGHHFGAGQAFAWLTPGAIGGLLVGSLALLAAAPAPPVANLRLAVLAAIVLVLAANLVPENPYHLHWLAQWRPGKLRDVLSAAELVTILWPFALLAAIASDALRGTGTAR